MTDRGGSTKHISLQVRDREGMAYTVRLAVAEPYATGTLSIQTPAGDVARQFGLSHLKKDRDGTQLSCYVGGATATLSLERDKDPPELHISASIFFPIFDAAYEIDPTEQERLRAWIDALGIGIVT